MKTKCVPLLLPFEFSSKTTAKVNVWEIVDASEPVRLCGVYFLIKDDEIVYVGQSKNILTRVGVHVSNGKIKFDKMCFIKCTPENLDALESLYIHFLDPVENATDIFDNKKAPLSFMEISDNLSRRKR